MGRGWQVRYRLETGAMGLADCASIREPSDWKRALQSTPKTVVLRSEGWGLVCVKGNCVFVFSLKSAPHEYEQGSYYRGVLIDVSVGPRLILYCTR